MKSSRTAKELANDYKETAGVTVGSLALSALLVKSLGDYDISIGNALKLLGILTLSTGIVLTADKLGKAAVSGLQYLVKGKKQDDASTLSTSRDALFSPAQASRDTHVHDMVTDIELADPEVRAGRSNSI
jgi:hypothetical protein